MRTVIRNAFAAVLVATVAASAAAQQPGKYAAFVENAKHELTKGFKDPGSAQFRNLAVYKSEMDGLVLCGEVNGKNSFGAYVGFAPFYADVELSRVKREEDELFDMFHKQWCKTKISVVK